MKEGDVGVALLPQADGQMKRRQVILLREMQPYNDLLICGLSTQLRQQVSSFDEIISPNDDDFSSSGLRSESLIRLGHLVVLPDSDIIGVIGTISAERRQRLLQKLCDYLLK